MGYIFQQEESSVSVEDTMGLYSYQNWWGMGGGWGLFSEAPECKTGPCV